MKSSVKKFSSFVIIVMLVVFALAIFATSSFAVKAEGPTSIELPLKLVKKVEFKLDESSALIEQPLAADENFTFKIGETEYTIGRGTHFNIPAGEGKVWQYKALKVEVLQILIRLKIISKSLEYINLLQLLQKI